MLSFIQPGTVKVSTTDHRGFTPEEIAERTVHQILNIADTADPKIKEQARAFKTRIFHIIVHSMKEAIVNDKTTLANKLREQGHKDMALILERL